MWIERCQALRENTTISSQCYGGFFWLHSMWIALLRILVIHSEIQICCPRSAFSVHSPKAAITLTLAV
jgi:hypothetical protein